MVEHQKNKVPCCIPCNLYKKNFRSDCNCIVCMTAWEIMATYILPRRKKDIPLIIMSDRGYQTELFDMPEEREA
jgi:hypothetical protein